MFNIADDRLTPYRTFTGNELYTIILNSDTLKYEERDFVNNIVDYCNRGTNGKALAIHGVRRTGKTIGMWHAINRLLSNGISADNILYIDINSSCTTAEILNIIDNSNQYYVFIDEATFIKDIVSRGRPITDSICLIKKVIITGTDSLMLSLCLGDSMLGRTEDIYSNRMTFNEFKRIYKIEDNNKAIVEFLRYSGTTMINSYDTELSLCEQINSAILWNIKHTIQNNTNKRYSNLSKLNDYTLLYLIYSYIMSVTLPKSDNTINNIDIKVDNNIKTFLLGKCDDRSTEICGIQKGDRESVKELLKDIGVLYEIQNIANTDNENLTLNTSKELIGAMNCMNYSINKIVNGQIITNETFGVLIENTVIQQIYNTTYRNSDYTIGYRRFNNLNGTPEIDVIVAKDYGFGDFKFTLIEIKQSDKPYSKHYKNFKDTDIIEMYGEDAKKIVVYRGETVDEEYKYNGNTQLVHFVSLCDFLSDIEKWIDYEK